MLRAIIRFLHAEASATAVEYAVMLALILITAIAAITNFGSSTGGLWGGIAQDISTVTGS